MIRRLSVFAILIAHVGILSAQDQDEIHLAAPLDPIDAILDAFGEYDVVTLSEGNHGNRPGQNLRLELVRDPRFPLIVDDIVVEGGNSRHQDLLDGFVLRDEELTAAEINLTAGMLQHNQWLFRAVRDINQTLPPDRKIRVLLGEPPIDRQNQTDEEIRQLRLQRDSYPADLIQREVVSKGRRALVVYGNLHFLRISPYFALSDPREAEMTQQGWRTLVQVLEEEHGITVFNIWASEQAHRVNTRLQPSASDWPIPNLALLAGTPFGVEPLATYYPQKMMVGTSDGGMEEVGFVPDRSGSMQEQFDAVLSL